MLPELVIFMLTDEQPIVQERPPQEGLMERPLECYKLRFYTAKGERTADLQAPRPVDQFRHSFCWSCTRLS